MGGDKLFDLFVKIFVTPENVIGIILNILGIISFCFIFNELNEKWWKSLIPIYNTYILYSKLWKHRWICILQFLFVFINTKSLIALKEHLINGILYSVRYIIENKEFNHNFDFVFILITSIFFILSCIIVFIMKRITFIKICYYFNSNLFIKIGTIIIPDVFLFISFIIYKYNKKNKRDVKTSLLLN